jgi:predicted flap endonuclease-1-like 5' DNA nuclease
MAERHMDRGPMFWSWLSWGIALIGALAIGFFAASVSGEGAPTGLVFGAVAFVVLIAILSRYLGPAPDDEVRPVADAHEPHHSAGAPAVETPAPAAVTPPPAAAAPSVAESVGPAPVAPAAVHTPPPDPNSGAISERVRSAARAAGEAARALGEPVSAAPAAEAKEPERLEGPREGSGDDLKKIKGVGPKLEELLQSLGFYHFDQIASWTTEELAWVDSHLEGFNGRASRDDWVGQARVLAAGGETEFSQRVDKGDVY